MFQEKLLPLLISFLLGFLLNSVLYMMPDIVVSKSDLFENISDDCNADNEKDDDDPHPPELSVFPASKTREPGRGSFYPEESRDDFLQQEYLRSKDPVLGYDRSTEPLHQGQVSIVLDHH